MSVPPLVYFDPSAKLDKRWKWRTNLKETDDFWSGSSHSPRSLILDFAITLALNLKGWFTGLSEKFLEASPGRLLVLASTETLDTTLTKGQVGGMFQMEILRDVGHSVHEVSTAFCGCSAMEALTSI
jgi:protein phosphatase methylesterase 1